MNRDDSAACLCNALGHADELISSRRPRPLPKLEESDDEEEEEESK